MTISVLIRRLISSRWLFAVTALSLAGPVLAHHSYAMFDGSRSLTVSGTVAKLEWMNPHVFIWVYVRNPSAQNGYDLYAFENGSTNVLTRMGWSKDTMKVGEKVSVEYWPLKDGRTGGHFVKATHADGRISSGVGGPNGAVPRAMRRTSHLNAALASLSVLLGPFAFFAFVGTSAHSADKRALPGMTYESLSELPDWSGWWGLPQPASAEFERSPPPMRPEDLARYRAQRTQGTDDQPKRYCKPSQFVGSNGGFVESVELLFTPGRVTISNESGLLRRIYTDGRSLPADVEPTNAGTSVGHWEGKTLVVETVGINPEAAYPQQISGAIPVGRNVRITERISLTPENTLRIDAVTIAPDILLAPGRHSRLYSRVPGKNQASEITFCTDFDRSVDATGKQRFDMTPPKGLPPPPPP